MLNLIKVWFYHWVVLPVFTVLPVSPHSPAPSLLSEFYLPPLLRHFCPFQSLYVRDSPRIFFIVRNKIPSIIFAVLIR